MQSRVSGAAPSNKMPGRSGRFRQALLIFFVGLVVLAASSHIMPDLVHPTSKARTAIFLVVSGAGLVCVLAGLALVVRAALFRSRT